MSSTLTESSIFVLRQKLGILRQPAYEAELSRLEAIILGGGMQHPYSISDYASTVMKEEGFRIGATGRSAVPPKQEFLYRYELMHKLIHYVNAHGRWKQQDEYPPNIPATELLASDVFEVVETRHRRDGGWLPLGSFAEGNYGSFRAFTWWTHIELVPVPRELVRQGYRLGRPNDWCGQYSIVVRCRLEDVLKHVRVPNVVDGFDSPVFQPTADEQSPPWGVAVNLEDAPKLNDGDNEYAVSCVPVEAVEFKPVRVPENDVTQSEVIYRPQACLDELWHPLHKLYQLMCGEK